MQRLGRCSGRLSGRLTGHPLLRQQPGANGRTALAGCSVAKLPSVGLCRYSTGPFRPTAAVFSDGKRGRKPKPPAPASEGSKAAEGDGEEAASKEEAEEAEDEHENKEKEDSEDSSESKAPSRGQAKPENGSTVSASNIVSASPKMGGNSSMGLYHHSAAQIQDLGSIKEFPPLLAIPVTKRPVFPGFYKFVTIQDPEVQKAVREIEARNNPFLVTSLTKDDNSDSDVVTSMDEIYDVGTLAQITSFYESPSNGLTVVLYPHTRVKINKLYPSRKAGSETESASAANKTSPASAASPPKAEATIEPEKLDTARPEAKESSGKNLWTNEYLDKYNIARVDVQQIELQPFDSEDPKLLALRNEIHHVFQQILSLTKHDSQNSVASSIKQVIHSEKAKNLEGLADAAASIGSGSQDYFQSVVKSDQIQERLESALVLIKNEYLSLTFQRQVISEIEQKVITRQKEFFWQEQLKIAQRELGIENDGREKFIRSLKERKAKLTMPEAVEKVFNDELTKFSSLDTHGSEFGVTRNYLDWLVSIPWGINSHDNYSINHALSVLEADHYGMKEVKDRILEFVAIGNLRGTVQGKIICLVGPPGVGKTSIGSSIARALERKFYRFSVGGLFDTAEIKGHRRTYIGAMPGKIMQALKKVGTENPLIMIDEIDKIGNSVHGNPASALLELLDSEQHNAFLDHYLDVPVDLSRTLFMCTANTTDTIPAPLLDRMEVIELSGYIDQEKVSIAERYLIPTAKEKMGIEHANINITPDAIQQLVRHYCRESGVRNLKKHIEKILRKASLEVVQSVQKAQGIDGATATAASAESEAEEATGNPERLSIPADVDIQIDSKNLDKYVGPHVFESERLYEEAPSGVVMGLAWTSHGGSALYIEAIIEQALSSSRHSSLRTTGSLGNVMKESSDLAHSYARSFMVKHFPENRFFEKANIHLHCPAGASPKDGPSAGVAMTSALLSLAMDTPIRPTVSMTGEITLTGKVLRIGGLREKVVAAKRNGCDTVIFPAENKADWEELPDHVKSGVTGLPVAAYDEVFDMLFPAIDRDAVNKLWREEIAQAEALQKGES